MNGLASYYFLSELLGVASLSITLESWAHTYFDYLAVKVSLPLN